MARARHMARGMAVVLGLGVVLATTGSGLAAPADTLAWVPFTFFTQAGQAVAAEAAQLQVPEDRGNGDGAQVVLPLVRFRATGAQAGAPIVLLEGGPGQPGIATARGRRYQLIERLRAHGDVIVLDQRGAGEASPILQCDRTADIGTDVELTESGWLAALVAPTRRCTEQLRRQGVNQAAYNNRENAQDIDDLRVALGAERLVLWGQSYGTQLALNVLRDHPDSVERAILHGVVGPDQYATMPKTTDKIVRSLLRTAERAGLGFADLAGKLDEVLARLEVEPATAVVTDPDTGAQLLATVGPYEMRFVLAFFVLGDHQLMSYLPAWIEEMYAGDFTSVATLGLELRRWRPPALIMAIVCTNGVSEQRQAKVDAQADRTLLGAQMRLADICPPWELPDLGGELRRDVVSDVPVLLISGTLDSVTPPANAKEIGKGLANSESLTLVGATHGDLVHGDPRIFDAIDAFLDGRRLPARRIVIPPWQFATPLQ